jgi:hypothetical protein
MIRRPVFQRVSRSTLRGAAIIAAVSVPLLAVGVAVAASSSGSGPPRAVSAWAGLAGTPIASCTVRKLPTLGGQYGNVTASAPNGDIVGLADNAAGTAQPVLWRAGQPQQIRTGMASSVPTGLNAHGVVIGDSARGENPVGWVWSRGRTTMLRGTGKYTALPAAISNNDIIVGALETAEGTPSEGGDTPGLSEAEQAAVWRSPTARPQKLAPLPGDQGGHAFAVARDGRIGGVSSGDRFRSVVWDSAGKPRALPGLGGGYGAVRAFGPGGIAVGDAVARNGTDHPVMWAVNGRITDLGLPAGSRAAQADGVLPDGVVVGTAQIPAPGGGTLAQAVRWTAAGHPQLLSPPGGTKQALVTGTASADTVTGYQTDAKGGRHPVMWGCGR